MRNFIYLACILFVLAGSTHRYDIPIQGYDTAMVYIEDVDGMVITSNNEGVALGNKVIFDMSIPEDIKGNYLLKSQITKDGEITEKGEVIKIYQQKTFFQKFLDWFNEVFI